MKLCNDPGSSQWDSSLLPRWRSLELSYFCGRRSHLKSIESNCGHGRHRRGIMTDQQKGWRGDARDVVHPKNRAHGVEAVSSPCRISGGGRRPWFRIVGLFVMLLLLVAAAIYLFLDPVRQVTYLDVVADLNFLIRQNREEKTGSEELRRFLTRHPYRRQVPIRCWEVSPQRLLSEVWQAGRTPFRARNKPAFATLMVRRFCCSFKPALSPEMLRVS